MSIQGADSIVYITSQEAKKSKNSGTGFVIYRDDLGTYVVTCFHVVRDLGGQDNLLVDGIPAKVIALGNDKGFDLAVLLVQDLNNKPILRVGGSAEPGDRFIIIGFSRSISPRLLPLRGTLGGEPGIVLSEDYKERTQIWKLKIESEDDLQPGYSGSPVINEISGNAMGVVIEEEGDHEGNAISIEGLLKIWPEMPNELFKEKMQPSFDSKPSNSSINIFLSYSLKDDKLREQLEESLSEDSIKILHQRKIVGGQNKQLEIQKYLNLSQIILLLISPSFMKDYSNNPEIKIAIEKYNTEKAIVIPILISSVAKWETRPFGNILLGGLKSLPDGGKFVTGRGWKNQNEALATIANELDQVIEAIKSK